MRPTYRNAFLVLLTSQCCVCVPSFTLHVLFLTLWLDVPLYCSVFPLHHCRAQFCGMNIYRLGKMQVEHDIQLIGSSREVQLDDSVSLSLKLFHTSSASMPSTGRMFYRCIVHNITYCSKCYTRTKKRNNFTVVYRPGGDHIHFGEIEYFLSVFINQSFHVYAYITHLVKQNTNQSHFGLPHNALDFGVPRIVQVSVNACKVLVNVNCILCKCVSVILKSHRYVCIPPNTLLLD